MEQSIVPTRPAGCARDGHMPDWAGPDWTEPGAVNPMPTQALFAVTPGGPAVISWRVYQRNADFNAVLAKVTADALIAEGAAMAERDRSAGVSHGHVKPHDNADRLVLWRRHDLETITARPGDFTPVAAIERMLSQAFADAPEAVTVDGNRLSLKVNDTPLRILERLATSGPPVDLLSITRRDGATVLRLRPGHRQDGKSGKDTEAI